MSVGLQRRVPALDESGAGVPAAWKSGNSEPPFASFAPPAGSPAGPAFAASPAPSTPGPGFAGPPYAAPGPFGSPSARPGSGGGFPPGPPQQPHFPGPGFAPPGSPFHPHPPHPPMPPHPHMMAPLPPPVDRYVIFFYRNSKISPLNHEDQKIILS
ncbi:unnamed protein product [Arctia plantaginis]|uniref:Uncharacterized protein n=1 Tax=Arctia plantaginis TaxID=874455 RepID=A0A8S1B0K5_ARCPL|nr:unnamed protein product [Arctia plantaginis]CAB3252413.1 unnamed protein product [Arctia plantaginis]